MKSTFRLWYSVMNGGDGSAYPVFFSSEAEADAHQECEVGWGEHCVGSIDITIDGDRLTAYDDTVFQLEEVL